MTDVQTLTRRPSPAMPATLARHRDKRGSRLPRGVFWYAPGVYGVRFVCGAGHDHKEPVSRLKGEAVRVHHERRARVLAESGWCPRAERRAALGRARIEEARARARMTLREYAKDYLEWAKTHKRSWRQDQSRLDSTILPVLGDRHLDEITTGDVERFRDSLLVGRTSATVNRYRDLLSGMFKRAVRLGLVGDNPVKGVPKLREAGQRLAHLAPEEEAAIREALPDLLRPAFTVSVNTGLRWSEQAGLRWRDVDMLTGIITVRISKNGTTRQVPLNCTVRSALLDLATGRRRPDDASEPLFTLSYRQTVRLFGRAVERGQAALRDAGRDASRLDGYTWHGNRHTFASRLVMAGVDLRTVQVLGGWKTLSMVARYSHLAPAHLHAAVERLVALAEPESSRKVSDERPKPVAVGVS
jgi:integrase